MYGLSDGEEHVVVQNSDIWIGELSNPAFGEKKNHYMRTGAEDQLDMSL